ncbi:hypothetical protein ACEQPO_29360 [Bacillus sp. SL00103]
MICEKPFTSNVKRAGSLNHHRKKLTSSI